MEHRIQLIEQANDELTEFIDATLRVYNQEVNAEFWSVATDTANQERTLMLSASDQNGRTVGGLLGETFFKWLKVHKLSVEATERGRGVGRSLMLSAEQEAVQRGCCYAVLDTMQYQAPDFYRKLGYQEVGRISDRDSHGSVKFFFVKTIG